MTPQELIKKYMIDSGELAEVEVAFKYTAPEKQIVYGEVYIPNVVDTHDEMMLAEDIEIMAHRFMARLKNDQIDLQHDNRVVKAVVVESFIAREGDPTFQVGSWVIAVKIDDTELWNAVKTGVYNGFSVETFISKQEAEVEFSFYPQVFGFTEKADGHEHAFFIQMDDEGSVVGGSTSDEAGHSHLIEFATATELAEKHAHRIALP
jgi:hypothetical protein